MEPNIISRSEDTSTRPSLSLTQHDINNSEEKQRVAPTDVPSTPTITTTLCDERSLPSLPLPSITSLSSAPLSSQSSYGGSAAKKMGPAIADSAMTIAAAARAAQQQRRPTARRRNIIGAASGHINASGSGSGSSGKMTTNEVARAFHFHYHRCSLLSHTQGKQT